jgi:hypothetical protein
MFRTQVGQVTPPPRSANSTRLVPLTSRTGPTPTARATSWECSGSVAASATSTDPFGPDPFPSPASTTSVPCNMFMPQAKPNWPARSGISSTVVRPNAARDLLTPKSGNTTRAEQSLFSWRSNTSRSGSPSLTRMRFGEYPPLTVISISWTPPRTSARRASFGPKKK